MESISSQKGKTLIVYSGYRYRRDRQNKDGSCTWRCARAGCKGRVKVVDSVIKLKSEHDHEANPSAIEAAKVVDAIRHRAKTTDDKPWEIIRRATEGISSEAASLIPEYTASQRSIHRQRKRRQLHLTNPDNVEEIHLPDVQLSPRGENFLLWDSGSSDDQRIFIFGTTQNLQLLVDHGHWFMDETIKTAQELFYQVYAVHVLIDHAAVPVIYALLCDKTEDSYTKLFKKLIELEPNLNPATVITDFEKASINALTAVFPSTRLSGSLFHLGQSLWRKIQDLNLTGKYREDEEFRTRAKMLLSLSFVPPADVIESFETLLEYLNDDMTALSDFWEDNYIGRQRRNRRASPLFPIAMWNVHNRVAEQADDSAGAFQLTVDCHHPSVFRLIDQLKTEQDHYEPFVHRFRFDYHKHEASKNEYVQLNKRLEAVVLEYGTINGLDFLRRIALNLDI